MKLIVIGFNGRNLWVWSISLRAYVKDFFGAGLFTIVGLLVYVLRSASICTVLQGKEELFSQGWRQKTHLKRRTEKRNEMTELLNYTQRVLEFSKVG